MCSREWAIGDSGNKKKPPFQLEETFKRARLMDHLLRITGSEGKEMKADRQD